MLFIDTHVHIYPHHSSEQVLNSFHTNARRYMPPAKSNIPPAFVLTEREGVDVFCSWLEGRGLPQGVKSTGIDNTLLRLERDTGEVCLVLAGRQIACRERVEILALACRQGCPDGVAADAAVREVLKADGLPVLAWGVGKWLLGRAAVVRRLLSAFPAGQLMIGDTSLRPVFWPEPRPMRRERLAGRRILYGSDPLAAASEAGMAGRYATVLKVSAKIEDVTSRWLCDKMMDSSVEAEPAGRRSSLMEFVRRMRGK